MFIKINGEEFEINTKLGTTFKIEKKFKKPYLRVLSSIDLMTAEEQVEMLACGIAEEVNVKKFKEVVDEIGLGELSEYLEEFIDGLQYPGLSEKEIEEKKLKKMEKQKKMKDLGLLN